MKHLHFLEQENRPLPFRLLKHLAYLRTHSAVEHLLVFHLLKKYLRKTLMI